MPGHPETDPPILWVYEMNHTGHHLRYVRQLAHAARAQGWTVRLVTKTEAINSREFDIHLSGVLKKDDVLSLSMDRPAIFGLLQLRRLVRGQDFAVLPDGDRLLPIWIAVLITRGPVRSAILLMRTRALWTGSPHRNLAKIISVAIARLVPNLRVLRLVPSLQGAAEPPPWGYGRTIVARDPAPATVLLDRHSSRAKFAISSAGPIGLLAGVIEPRKCITEILDWLVNTANRPLSSLILAGTISDEIRSILEQPIYIELQNQGRLYVYDRYMSETDMNSMFAAADFVFALYRNSGPSGMVNQAMATSRPIVAWGSRDVTSCAISQGVGVVAASLTVEDLDLAILSALVINPMPSANRDLANARTFVSDLLGQRVFLAASRNRESRLVVGEEIPGKGRKR